MLFSVMGLPMRAKNRSMSARVSSSNTSFRPNASAAAFFVMSSQVGPSPPVMISTSERDSARSTASLSRSGLSPTVVWW